MGWRGRNCATRHTTGTEIALPRSMSCCAAFWTACTAHKKSIMTKKATPAQKLRVLALLQEGLSRDAIACDVGITPAQVSAVAAHRTMGTYSKSKPTTGNPIEADDPRTMLTDEVPELGNVSEMNVIAEDVVSATNPIWLGTDSHNESVFWNPNPDLGSPNPHVLIIGESGFGKTYATPCLVAELAQSNVPSIIFDYGQGFSSHTAPGAFLKCVKASQFELNKDGIAKPASSPSSNPS